MFTFINSSTIISWTILLLAVIIKVQACTAGPDSALGAITEDAEIQEGTKFIVRCDLKKLAVTLNGKSFPVNSSNIFFTRGGSDPIKPQIINDRSAQIELSDARKNDSGQYFCFVEAGQIDRQLVCYMELIVGQRPRDIENVKCVSEYYQNLTCVWNPPDYNTETTYTLIEEGTNEPCPHRLNKTACQWTLSGYPHYRQAAHMIYLTLESSNKYGNHTQKFQINNFAIIRPPPPEKLYEADVSPSSVELRWEIDPTLDLGPLDSRSEHPVLEFQIFKEDISNGDVEVININEPIKSYVSSGLVPATVYRFSVRCRTIQSKSNDFWSEFSNITVVTKSDRPYRFPLFFNESFDSVPKENGLRSITLFWTPVHSKFFNTRNGTQFHYRIKYFPIRFSRRRRDAVNEPSTEIIKPEVSHYTFKDLSSLSDYSFRIHSENEKGESSGFSQIKVAKQAHLPQKPKNFQALSYGGGRYELRWDVEPQVDHYVISWCTPGQRGSVHCLGPLNSSVVRGSGQTLSDLQGLEYNFAISSVVNSLKYGQIASEMLWATCVVPMAAPGKPGKLLFSLAAVGTDSLRLQWKLSCPGLHVIISKYEVIYCRLSGKNGSCLEEKKIVINDSRAESFALKGIREDTYYRVSMKMWNDNIAGEESDELEARTGIETDFTLWIFIAVLAIILTFVMLIICRSICLKMCKDNDMMKRPIELPGILGDSSNLTKSINGQACNRNGKHLTSIDHLRKNSGGSVASSTGLINPKQHTSINGFGNTIESNGTEMKVMSRGDLTDSMARESCADDNSNTSHDSGLGTQSNGLLSSLPKVSSKAYVTHERLNEMGRLSTTCNPPRVTIDGSQSVMCQINDGSSQFTPSKVPARMRPEYVQV